MQAELDQSGKVEDTNRPTALGLANGVTASLIIAASDKQELQRFFRQLGQPRIFVLKTFIVLVAILLQRTKQAVQVLVLDTEYPGHDEYLRRELVEMMGRTNRPLLPEHIHIQPIGKKSPAHSVAYRSFRSKQATYTVTARDVLRMLI